MEALPGEFNLFEKPTFQTAILEEYDEPIDPTNTLQEGAPITFNIAAVSDLYRDLNNSMLQVKCKVTMANGANVANATSAAPVNLTLHALFANVEMEVKEKLITDPNQLYPYRAYLETLANYSEDVLKTRHYAEGWQKDLAAQIAVTNPGGANTGHTARGVRFGNSATVTLMGRLHLDLFHQDKCIPGNVPIKIRLIPSGNSFVLNSVAPTGQNAQENYKMVITSARLYVRTKKVSPSLVLAHRQMLQETNYVMNYTKVTLKKYTIPAQSSTANFNSLYQGFLPDRVVVCFVRDDALTGSYVLNPMNLEHYDINYIAMTVNGEMIPKVPLQPNFTTGDYIREYMDTLAGLEFDTGDRSIDLTTTEWATGFTFWVFKLTPGSIGTVRTAQRGGVANLEIKFANPTPRNISMICLEQHPATLEFDKFDNPILS